MLRRVFCCLSSKNYNLKSRCIFLGDGNDVWKKKHVRNFIIKIASNEKSRCGLNFTLEKKLKEHKRQQNHLKRKRKPLPGAEVHQPKQLRLEEVMVLNEERQQDTSLNENESEDNSVCKLCK